MMYLTQHVKWILLADAGDGRETQGLSPAGLVWVLPQGTTGIVERRSYGIR